MSSGINSYYKALEETKKWQATGSKGYSDYLTSGVADQELIKQNNTMISLLVQVIDKIEQLEHRLKLMEEENGNNAKIDSLIIQINNLKLEDSHSSIKKMEVFYLVEDEYYPF